MIRHRGFAALAAVGVFILAGAWPGWSNPAYCDDVRGAAGYLFKFQFGDQPLYYIIEDEFRDSGGVPPLISYSTSIKERRSIIQRRNAANAPPIAVAGSPLVSVVWECDRYEAREQGMKEESVYDSLRHQFAPASIQELEANADSKVAFLMNPTTGEVSSITITPGPLSNKMARHGSISKTVEKCCLTQATMKQLLDTLGYFYLPDGTRKVGDVWDRTTIEPQGTFGVLTTTTHTKLTAVKKVEGRDVAYIDISSTLTLKNNPPPQSPAVPRPPTPVRQAPPRVSASSANGDADGVKPADGKFAGLTPTTQATVHSTTRPATLDGRTSTTQPSPKMPVATTPATQPARVVTSAPVQKPPAQREFRLDKGILSGSVEFDLTRGELVQMNLRRETVFVADVESQGMGKMQLRSGTAQNLHIKTSRTPPPKPVIVGGKAPPKLSQADMDALAAAEKNRVVTTQPANLRPLSTQPSSPHRGQRIMSSSGPYKDTLKATRHVGDRASESKPPGRAGPGPQPTSQRAP